MTERIMPVSELEERSGGGQEKYVSSMERSAETKANELEPWLSSEGDILDYGAGAGPLTDIFSKRHPDRKFVAIDLSDDMFNRMKERFKGRENVTVIQADIRDYIHNKPFGTVMATSVFHELFSFNNYNHEVVVQTLRTIHNNPNFLPSGRIVIRDGVQPEPETLYLRPLTEFACDRFTKFAKGFGKVRPVNFMIGNFIEDVFVQSGRREFRNSDIGQSLIEISSQNASEMFSKYFYPEENLPVELSEQFGIWSLREYQKILLNTGYAIRHANTHVLPYLIDNHYSKDFEVYHLVNGVLSNAPYPPSTMLLVGEK